MTQRSLNVGGLRDDRHRLGQPGDHLHLRPGQRLIYVAPVAGVGWAEHEYNETGARVRQTVNYVTTEYALDTSASLSAGLATGLTQVLTDSDGNAYLYGHGRIAQEGAAGIEYFLTDALGSVRQLVDASGNVTLARSYRPYGGTLISDGDGASPYGPAQPAAAALYQRRHADVPLMHGRLGWYMLEAFAGSGWRHGL